MIPFKKTNRGLIKMIIFILIALLLLAYFGFNLRSIVGSPTFHDNWNFLKGLIVDLWNNILKAPLTYLWNIFVPLIWNPALHNLEQMKDTAQTATTSVSSAAASLPGVIK
jgi:hypothetical protein